MVFAMAAFTFVISSCKKTNSTTDDEVTTTLTLGANQAIADNLTEDANDVLNETAVQYNFSGSRTTESVQTTNILSCATVTVTPLQGFPKTVVIDFGTGCTSTNGIVRKGKINVTISDSLRKSGSVAVMTFDGYYVSGYKKEGTITWTNTSQGGTRSWQRKVENGKITAPDGSYWMHTALKNITQIAGSSTPNNLLDDVYSITGTSTVTNASGVSRTSTILQALEKQTTCSNIDKGQVKVQGPNHYAVIDYGDGTCDNVATISIDGGAPKTILLR